MNVEIIRPSLEEIQIVNQSREHKANVMASRSKFIQIGGMCGADDLMLHDIYASEAHLKTRKRDAEELIGTDETGRLNAVKSRSHIGDTGLLNQPGGAEIYASMASGLVYSRVSLAAEVVGDVDFAIAGPRLSIGWTGARNAEDAGPRNLLRPTTEDLENGIHPILAFLKNAPDGDMQTTFNGIRTIQSEIPVTRTRFTLDGLVNVTTHGNPHTGVILRGNKHQRPTEDIDGLVEEEVTGARNALDEEFGEGRIPLIFDFSHLHATLAGGGAEGQIRMAESVVRLLGRDAIDLNGAMLESYKIEGKQPIDGDVPGLSKYDECVNESDSRRIGRMLDFVVAGRTVFQAV